jgi:hypothetical protein
LTLPSPSIEAREAPPNADEAATASARAEVVAPPATLATPAALPTHKLSIMDRLDRFVSRLSTRSHFWHRVTSLVWLPYAFKSGIKMKRVDGNTFSAVLPYRRFNLNWYRAMAGASLLANSEIAGGMYLFSACGGDWTVVCKNLEYKFLRPCYGPAIYKITPREEIAPLLAAGKEFNITIDMDILQQAIVPKPVRGAAKKMLPEIVGKEVAGKDKRVGKCSATFHVTPKQHQQSKGRVIR